MTSSTINNRILFVSNAGWIPSGYGVQTRLFTRLMAEDGYEPITFGAFGHKGPNMTHDGVMTVGMSSAPDGSDMISEHQRVYKPGVTIILYDVWPYAGRDLERWDAAVWLPVDHDPVPAVVTQRLDFMRPECTWVYTRWAKEHLRSRGYDSVYIPLAVDIEAYQPIDRSAARAKMQIDDDIFLAVMVGANKTYPDRKGFDRTFAAWSRFITKHPKSLLYVHTWADDQQGGHDLLAMARFYGIQHHIRFPLPYNVANWRYTSEHMNWLYNAGDVLVMPSRTEGFGVPAIEAQAAGCPVIVSDFGAQSELGEVGYRVRIDDDDKLYTRYGSEIANPKVSEIFLQLEMAHHRKKSDKMRVKAREFALQYDHKRVWRDHMKPAVQRLLEIEQERAQRTERRIQKRKVDRHEITEGLPADGNGGDRRIADPV